MPTPSLHLALERPGTPGPSARTTPQAVKVEPVDDPPSHASTDAWLVSRLDRLDEEALAMLYDRHSGAVYALLLRLLDRASAQEVLQDVFLRLWQRPQSYDPARGELRVYLLVLARSRALDRLRQERGEWRLYDEQGQDFPLSDDRQDPFALAAGAEQRERISLALAQLSGTQRETVMRALVQGESREETAREMGVPVGTVKSRLNTALGHLRRLLNGSSTAGGPDE